jgi:hypothetical protein|tara:strand:- start:70 stop:273 length:204 start_codon:yes stop_codon:yes gene_type:complete
MKAQFARTVQGYALYNRAGFPFNFLSEHTKEWLLARLDEAAKYIFPEGIAGLENIFKRGVLIARVSN